VERPHRQQVNDGPPPVEPQQEAHHGPEMPAGYLRFRKCYEGIQQSPEYELNTRAREIDSNSLPAIVEITRSGCETAHALYHDVTMRTKQPAHPDVPELMQQQ